MNGHLHMLKHGPRPLCGTLGISYLGMAMAMDLRKITIYSSHYELFLDGLINSGTPPDFIRRL